MDRSTSTNRRHPQARIALTTTSTRAHALKLARALVDRRLAACVNVVGPITSIYRWQGKRQSDAEFLLIIKTTQRRVETVRAALEELHTYDLPEFVVVAVDSGSKQYLQWLEGAI